MTLRQDHQRSKVCRTWKPRTDGSVEFEFAAGEDVRPEVAKAVIQAGYELIELRPLGMSLEEIFLELTGDNLRQEIKRNP